jgi:ABC-type Zn uptake system ZnuABC Zn-binding protein ZnuA
MKLLSHAQIFLLHCWQGRRFGEEIIRASGNRTLKRVVLEVKGNWMVPAVQIAATDRIVAVLAEADPARADAYRSAGERRKAEVQRIGSAQAKRLREAAAGSIAVLANEMQADLIRWAGFQVVGTFGRGEDMSPRDMEADIRRGREKSVHLVVDNLQSGKAAGVIIAKEIGAEQVTLSNFPGALPDTGSWAKAFEQNVDLLLAAIGKP